VNTNTIHKLFFIGIGGIGMSSLARYFNSRDKEVMGYDKTETALTKELCNENISVHYTDNIALIPSSFTKENTLVIYTPAIPGDHSQLNYFVENGYKVIKRAEALGEVTKQHTTLAVAGTHGKTTTSTLLAHILLQTNDKCTAFLGGISSNYNTNYIEHTQSNKVVVEADEFDRSFLKLSPTHAIITSTDADHLDIYGDKKSIEKSFNDFADLVSEILVVKKGISIHEKHISYSIVDSAANYFAKNIHIENHHYVFDAITPNAELKNIICGLPGRHNVENALAALALCLEIGIEAEIIVNAIASFKGVKRRFEYQINENNCVYIDDYAHHPEELNAFISSVKELYPNDKITGVFQPHLYSRTKDFAEGFGESLSLLDKLYLLPIYPARELPMEGVTSEWLLTLVKQNNKVHCHKQELLNHLDKDMPKVFLTMGAGDIDQLVEPIKKHLKNQIKHVA
jgi:UDP-N-acetylmuramate--alanine ligase